MPQKPFVPSLEKCRVHEAVPFEVSIDDSDAPRFLAVEVFVQVELALPDGERVLLEGIVAFSGFPSDGPLRPAPPGANRSPTEAESKAIEEARKSLRPAAAVQKGLFA